MVAPNTFSACMMEVCAALSFCVMSTSSVYYSFLPVVLSCLYVCLSSIVGRPGRDGDARCVEQDNRSIRSVV